MRLMPDLFLVVLRLSSDDVPMAVFRTMEEAKKFIMNDIPSKGVVPEWITDFDRDWRDWVNVAIAYFENGRLVGYSIVRDHEDEE